MVVSSRAGGLHYRYHFGGCLSRWVLTNQVHCPMTLVSHDGDHMQVRQPRYQQIAETLAAELAAEEAPQPGDLLASEAELGARCRVSRVTVRGALKRLAHHVHPQTRLDTLPGDAHEPPAPDLQPPDHALQ